MPQFTLKSVFISLALVGISLACAMLCYAVAMTRIFEQRGNVLLLEATFFVASAVGGASFGAAIGVLFHRKLVWAMIGVLIVIIAELLAFEAIVFG